MANIIVFIHGCPTHRSFLGLHLRGKMFLNCNEIHVNLVFLNIKPVHKLL